MLFNSLSASASHFHDNPLLVEIWNVFLQVWKVLWPLTLKGSSSQKPPYLSLWFESKHQFTTSTFLSFQPKRNLVKLSSNVLEIWLQTQSLSTWLQFCISNWFLNVVAQNIFPDCNSKCWGTEYTCRQELPLQLLSFFPLILIYKVYMYNGYYIELKFVTMLVRFSMGVHLSVNCKFAEIQSA